MMTPPAPRVTWLLPVKNGMPFLPDTLASLEAQTWTDWDVLAWDNGSTDGTLDVLREWIPARLPGRVVSDRPMGLGASLAEMVQECGAELLARIDADDVCLPERLEKQVAFLDAHPEVAAVGSGTRRLDEKGRDRGLFHAPSALAHDEIVHSLLFSNPLSHPTMLLRRAAVLDAGNYRDVGAVNIEDYDLWLRLAQRHKLANLPETLVSYRVHPGSATQISTAQGQLEDALATRFAEHAPVLYGITAREAKLLRMRQIPFALPLFDRINRHLQKTQGGGSRYGSASFRQAIDCLSSPADRRTFSLLPTRTFPGPRAWAGVGKSVLRAGLARLRGPVPAAPPPGPAARWRQAHPSGAGLHPTLEVTGRTMETADWLNVGTNVTVERDVTVWLSPDDGSDPLLTVGDGAFVGRGTYIGVFQPVSIGRFALVGAYCYIVSANHVYLRRDVPIQQQGFAGAPVVIAGDVWLGTHVVVLPGVTIGQGAIVAAGSVVTKTIPPYEVWGGVPARFLKARPEQESA